LAKFSDYLAENLRQEVELADPWGNLTPFLSKRVARFFPKKKSLAFATCLGLALRGASADPVTREINLITQEKQKAFEEKDIRKFISRIANLVIMSALLATFAFLGMWVFFAYENFLLTKQIEREEEIFKTKDPQNLEGFAKEFNERVRLMRRIQREKQYVANLFTELDGLIPAGIRFIEFSWDGKDTIKIRGKALLRDQILTFKQNLAASGKFTNIDIPLSSLEAKENVLFDMQMELTKEMKDKLSSK
jgi:Tfp pilus assembly protein PilN